MRPIKFRLWDKKLNKFWHDFRIHPHGTFHPATTHKEVKGVDYWVYDYKYNQKHLIPLQYTGLTDKRGIETYEGDIVQPYAAGTKVDTQVVKYLEHGFGMCDSDTTSSLDGIWYYDFEVIGNIYENPELLK